LVYGKPNLKLTPRVGGVYFGECVSLDIKALALTGESSIVEGRDRVEIILFFKIKNREFRSVLSQVS
jgi:hypothetical protein